MRASNDESPPGVVTRAGSVTDRVGSADNAHSSASRLRADQLRSGDVILGFPVGPMTVRRVSTGTAHGKAIVNIAFEVYARMSVRPDREFEIERADALGSAP